MNTQIGRFITFEGGEGVGKSTNIQFVAQWLAQQGISALVTREPGGTPIAERIRNDLLKAHHSEKMADLTELLLMFAARAQHLKAVIIPALASGQWVLCDRFTDSTIAYQGYGRGVSLDQIDQLRQLVQGDLNPDCTLLLDAPFKMGMSRAAQRASDLGEEVDRFETEDDGFFNLVRQGFLTLAKAESRIHIIDASQHLSAVQGDIISVLTPMLGNGVSTKHFASSTTKQDDDV
ncbi:MAG: dTMP kinase [Oleibacter sp.]|nr:dTMP kinase [Thalassolituus sp.]